MRITRVRFWRRVYLIFSMALGIISPLICWYMLPDFNPIEKPLSYFGVAELTSWYWNLSLIILAFAIYLNGKKSIIHYFKIPKRNYTLSFLLFISFIALLLTAIIPMDNKLPHRISASFFFLIYNLFVFCFGIFYSFKYVRKGFFSIVIGCLMLLSCLLLIPFPSYGVFEIIYILLIIFWNASLFYKRVNNENKYIPK